MVRKEEDEVEGEVEKDEKKEARGQEEMMGKGRSSAAQKRGGANCLSRQRTLILPCDPF